MSVYRTFGAGVMLCTASAAFAHHSTAAYDPINQKTISGTVERFYWTNPHMFVYLRVADGKGGTDLWTLEAGTPSINSRQGWRPDMIKAGDKVTVLVSPTRNKPNDGQIDTITLPGGKQMMTPGHDFAQIAKGVQGPK